MDEKTMRVKTRFRNILQIQVFPCRKFVKKLSEFDFVGSSIAGDFRDKKKLVGTSQASDEQLGYGPTTSSKAGCPMPQKDPDLTSKTTPALMPLAECHRPTAQRPKR